MLTTAQIDSVFFCRLAGRLSPKLTHPTAKAFDVNAWTEVTKADVVGPRDEVLARTSDLIGFQMHVLRERYLSLMFGPLSRSTIIDLSVADANQVWTILRRKMRVALAEGGAEGGAENFSAMGKVDIPVGHEGALVSPDDANNASVDSLPHWFAVAADAPEQDGPGEVDLEKVMVRAQMGRNLEHAYRDVWQEVLWEP